MRDLFCIKEIKPIYMTFKYCNIFIIPYNKSFTIEMQNCHTMDYSVCFV